MWTATLKNIPQQLASFSRILFGLVLIISDTALLLQFFTDFAMCSIAKVINQGVGSGQPLTGQNVNLVQLTVSSLL